MKSKSSDENKISEEKILGIDPGKRILLLSHCIRPSQDCTAKMSKDGLMCKDDCTTECILGKLRKLATKMGYIGVCIAPGGSMALKFIKKTQPEAIIAIACMKELSEGIDAVEEITGDDNGSSDNGRPVIVVLPLLKDGCVDTEVDEEEAIRIVGLKSK